MNRLCLLCLLMIVIQTSTAQDLIPKERIGLELQSFYQHPSTHLLVGIVKSIDLDSAISGNENTWSPFIGFLVVALHNQPSRLNTIQALVDSLSTAKALVAWAIALSQTKDTVLNWPDHSPTANDLLWGGFFASGDTRYLNRLIFEMRFCSEKDSLGLYLTGASAKWSLCSNARQYHEVKVYLEEQEKVEPPALQPHIHDVLTLTPSQLSAQMVDGVKGFKKRMDESKSLKASESYKHDGLQILFALIGNKKFFEEWNRPDPPNLKPLDTYQRGDHVFAIIIFGTNGINASGSPNITYDLTVKKPDGSVYGQFKDLVVWQNQPVPVGNLYMLKQPIDIGLEKSDPLGKYSVRMTVHDHIKKADVESNLSFLVKE